MQIKLTTATTIKIPFYYKGRYAFWRIAYLITAGVLLAASLGTYYFIYQNLYLTLTNANIIMALKENSILYELNIGFYEQASKVLENKEKKLDIPANLRNIFYYTSSTIPHAGTSAEISQ